MEKEGYSDGMIELERLLSVYWSMTTQRISGKSVENVFKQIREAGCRCFGEKQQSESTYLRMQALFYQEARSNLQKLLRRQMPMGLCADEVNSVTYLSK